MALGEVGLILSRELSRLLRTDKDFCQLVELCQLFGTLLGDEETIYDTSGMDERARRRIRWRPRDSHGVLSVDRRPGLPNPGTHRIFSTVDS